MIEMLKAYQASGWALVQIPTMKKGPIETSWPTIDYTIDNFSPHDNVGIKLGAPSGGLVDIDLDCDEALQLAPVFLPETATFGRASKPKSHWLYRCTTKTQRPSRTSVELRSTGLQTVFPPSLHETGERIEWSERSPFPVEISEADLLAAVGRLASASLVARLAAPMQEMRMVHDCTLSLAGILWSSGWSEEDAVTFLLNALEVGSGTPDSGHREQAIRSTFEPIDKERTGWTRFEELVGPADARALKRALRITGVETKAAKDLRSDYALNDDGNAQRLVDLHGSGMLYADGMGWLAWTGRRWELSAKGPWGEALEISRMLMEQGKSVGGPAGETLERWGRQTGNVSRLEAMIKAASRHPDVAVEVEDLDSDPWLFNVQNGTVDLRTGTLRPHSKEDRITKLSPANFDLNATAPRFDRFILEVFRGDRELASYMLRFMGYCLTGATSEQALALWHGPSGANGKSTLIELALEIMGDYAGTIAPDLLLDSGTQHPTGLMDLKGKRLVVASELEEGKRWKESLVKRITGGDRIKARYMRENFVEFSPTHKLVVIVNARPIVRGTGRSFWRRMHLVPWLVSFEGREERDLPAKLRTEMSGVLRYMVAGCLAWQAGGLRQPSTMLDAGDDYRASQDVIGQFLSTNTTVEKAGHCNRSELYQRFRMWGTMRQEHVPPASAFYRMIEERGYSSLKRNGIRGFFGLTISPEVS